MGARRGGKPGPKAHPALRLKDAAIEYAAAVEAEGSVVREWNRLVKAALGYARSPRPRGAPRLYSSAEYLEVRRARRAGRDV